jgi:hypothetical protein
VGDISSGFQTSTTETYIFLGLLGVFFIALFFYQLYRQHANRRAAEERKKNPPKPILPTHSRPRRDLINLSTREQRTLDHLAWFLKDPGKPEKLIDDDHLIVRAARKGIREGIVTEAEVLRLLNKLEVNSEALTAGGKNSASIPTGAEVSISDRNLNMAVGELLLSGDEGMQVRIEKGNRVFAIKTPVEVVCNSQDGMYRFHSAVLRSDGKQILLQHSRYVEHVQRRKYRRREVELPVEVMIPGISSKPLKTKTFDISIGGAAIKNPRKKIGTGTRVDCTVDSDGAAPITVPGTALRTSRRGKIVHVSFGPVDEKTRHRLFRKLIRLRSSEA